MAQIGDSSATGFIVDPAADGVVVANKYTAPSTFTPTKIEVDFTEAFGADGTMYVAVYADNAGVPGNKLFDGSAAYNGAHSGVLTVPVTGSELTNGSVYWLAAYADADGTYNVDFESQDSATDQGVLSWTEGVMGSWTNNPTTSTLAADREIALEANDEAAPGGAQAANTNFFGAGF